MLLARRNNDSDWLSNFFDDTLFNTEVMSRMNATAPAINIPNVYWRNINVALLPSLHIIPVMFRINMLIITIAIIVIITNIRILPEKIPQAAPLLPPSR